MITSFESILKPVCSKEGETFDNECQLKCEGAEKKCDGMCPCGGITSEPSIYTEKPACYCKRLSKIAKKVFFRNTKNIFKKDFETSLQQRWRNIWQSMFSGM